MFIYKITNIVNGKIYIGSTTKTVEIRFWLNVENLQRYRQKEGLVKFKNLCIAELEREIHI